MELEREQEREREREREQEQEREQVLEREREQEQELEQEQEREREREREQEQELDRLNKLDFRARCEALGLKSQEQIGRAFHRNRNTIRRWLTTGKDGYGFPPYVNAMLLMLEQEQKERQL